MNKVQIMILGKDEMDIAPIMQQLKDVTEWETNAFTDKEDAVGHFVAETQDVVIFTRALESETKNGLAKLFRFQEEDVIILSDADEKDIQNKANDALHQLADAKRPQYSFMDDALKHARFNISLN